MDIYLKSLYDTLELCTMILLRKHLFTEEHILKVEQLKKETEYRIYDRIDLLKLIDNYKV